MKLKHLLFVMLLLCCAGLSACGSSGSEGLNGGITVDASATGSVINATASYTHPTQSNLIGVPISFSLQIGGFSQDLGTHSTNNTGSVGIAFSPPAFNGTQTITVIARTDNLTNFDSLVMTGRSLSIAAPPALSLTTVAAGGNAVPFTIPSLANFVTITDPFNNDVDGHPIQIEATAISSNPGSSLSPPSDTTTGSGGIAPFPGATGVLIVPAAVGGVETMTITWRVTDVITGQSGSAITTVTLTKTS
jgi:hypothetical protein